MVWQPLLHQLVRQDGRATCRRCGRWVPQGMAKAFAGRRCVARYLMLDGAPVPDVDWGAVVAVRLGSAGWEARRYGGQAAQVGAAVPRANNLQLLGAWGR